MYFFSLNLCTCSNTSAVYPSYRREELNIYRDVRGMLEGCKRDVYIYIVEGRGGGGRKE